MCGNLSNENKQKKNVLFVLQQYEAREGHHWLSACGGDTV